VELSWLYRQFPFKLKLYTLPNDMITRLNEVGNFQGDIRKQLRILNEVLDGKVSLVGTSYQMMALVTENPTNKPVWFFASPHKTEPVTETMGIKFFCLCFGETFRVRANSGWYRIVMLRLFPSNRSAS